MAVGGRSERTTTVVGRSALVSQWAGTVSLEALSHFDGSNWTQQSLGTTAAVLALWGTGADIWAACADGSLYRRRTSSWSLIQVGSSSNHSTQASISGSGTDDVWVMFNSMLGGLYPWDGSTWNWLGHNVQLVSGPPVEILYSDSPAPFSNGRYDLYLAMFEFSSSFATVVLHYDGSSWTREPVGAGTRPLGLCGQAGRGLWLVGGDPPGMGGSASVLYHSLP